MSDRSSCNHSVDSCRSKQIGEGCLNLSSCVFPPPLPSPVKTKVQSRFPLLCSTIPPSWSYFWLSHLSSYSASYCRSFYLSNILRRGPGQILQADRLQLPARLCHNQITCASSCLWRPSVDQPVHITQNEALEKQARISFQDCSVCSMQIEGGVSFARTRPKCADHGAS